MKQPSVLVVAALATELGALMQRLDERQPVRRAGRSGWRGRVAGRRVELFVSGMGSEAAQRAVTELGEDLRPSCLLGLGLAGALTPELSLNDIVCVERALALDSQEQPVIRASARGASSAVPATAVSSQAIVSTATEKRSIVVRLGLVQAAVVDLESHAWAAAAVERGLPWGILRAVSDTSEEDLPLDFETYRSADGQLQAGAVARAALFRPQLWGGLGGLALRMRRCSEALAEGAIDWLGSRPLL